MCLAIPGRIVEIVDEGAQIAKAEVGGVRRNINISLVQSEEEPVQTGDWVLIHVGFALSKVNEAEAQWTLRALEEIGAAYQQELQELHASRIE
jgi:hydrogenase expression/formation protein HypC